MNNKEALLRKVNEAFAQNDADVVIASVAEDIRWTIVGDQVIEGKDRSIEALREMAGEKPFEVHIGTLIMQGEIASLEGTMRSAGGEAYAFCDIYRFSGMEKPKIKEMTSYVIKTGG